MACQKSLDFAPPAGAHLSFYWTMDEGGTTNKSDSTVGLVWPLVPGTSASPGLFNNGTHLDNTAFGKHGLLLIASPSVMTTATKGISFWFWVKVNTYINAGIPFGPFFIITGFDNNPAHYGEVDCLMGTSVGGILSVAMQLCNSDPFPCDDTNVFTNAAGNTFHMIAGVYDAVAKTMNLYFDGNLVETFHSLLNIYSSTALTLWCAQTSAVVEPDLVIDELGICLEGVLSQAQITSLFNGGAGVTWPNITPIVPYP